MPCNSNKRRCHSSPLQVAITTNSSTCTIHKCDTIHSTLQIISREDRPRRNNNHLLQDGYSNKRQLLLPKQHTTNSIWSCRKVAIHINRTPMEIIFSSSHRYHQSNINTTLKVASSISLCNTNNNRSSNSSSTKRLGLSKFKEIRQVSSRRALS